MALPSIEKFEGDIAGEIQEKETTMTDIIAAHKTAQASAKGEHTLLLLVVFFILGLALVFGGAYYLYTKSSPTPSLPGDVTIPTPIVPSDTSLSLAELLPITSAAVGRFIPSTHKEGEGYALTINDYTSVYGYLLHNEDTFGKEALSLFGETTSESPIFMDVTQANQDMRVATLSGGGSVTYGFVGTSTLIIATTPETFFNVRSAILR